MCRLGVESAIVFSGLAIYPFVQKGNVLMVFPVAEDQIALWFLVAKSISAVLLRPT